MSDFADLLRKQRELQVESFGTDPATLDGEERVEFIRWNALALSDELHEMLQEVGWKPWATSRHVNEELATKELVDLFHFFMNILWTVAPSSIVLTGEDRSEELARDFMSRYYAKHDENARRQREGYDGVAGKCPNCKRELSSTIRILEDHDQEGATTYCSGCGYVIHGNE